MTWLLTGGAGYIGAHVARALSRAGHDVVALDDLSTGVPERLGENISVVEASVLDTERVRTALREHAVTGVVHLAAKKAVGESVARPLHYYEQNVGGVQSLLAAMTAEGVNRLVFSSSAAVYGMPDVSLVTEDTVPAPINPYGQTKLVGEWMVRAVAAATGLSWISLRYFNVAGAEDARLGDVGVANLIPLVFRAVDEGRPPEVFGEDYPTPDGSCIRDYVHVQDLAEAHVAGVDRLAQGPAAADVYNVGRGQGASVKEVLDVVTEVTGLTIDPKVTARRPGDPARLVASAGAIERDLGWTASRDLHDMVDSAWTAWTARRQ